GARQDRRHPPLRSRRGPRRALGWCLDGRVPGPRLDDTSRRVMATIERGRWTKVRRSHLSDAQLGPPGLRLHDPKRQHELLRSAAVYGPTTWNTDAFLRYALIWEEQPAVGKLRWNAFRGRDPADPHAKGDPWPEQYQALVQGFWRPDLVCPSEPGEGYFGQPAPLTAFASRRFSIWRDEAIDAWSLHQPT